MIGSFRFWVVLVFWIYAVVTLAQPQTGWPEQSVTTKPGSRWWWMGSAVDKVNLTNNLEAYAGAGIGTLEITPIYGVQGNDSNEIDFLSERWMEVYRHTLQEANRLGLKIDMNTGTGWPFGGPEVTIDHAACKLMVNEYHLKRGDRLDDKIEVSDPKQKESARLMRLMAYSDKGACIDLTAMVQNQLLDWKAPRGKWRLIAAFAGNTGQQVKRAAPGGSGLVIDHFSPLAVNQYLSKFSEAFSKTGSPAPNSVFNDSYEVYGADWTPRLFEEFEARRGYKLEEYLPQFLDQERNELTARIISDYRETLAGLLLEYFTRQWTNWAHQKGSKTRNQAHGSPGNLIDLYAAVDIPECEGFGLSDFNIKGLRQDSLTRHNDSDLSMLKYASSAAHISGKPFTSSETFTWLTEHFRTSFSQCKPDLDLMFVSGVNRVFFHGTTYSPALAPWPGYKFYASVDMSPTNPLWRDIEPFNAYISRVQSFLQMGQPDNDFLLYVPVYDMWHEQEGRLLMFDIHKMAQRAPAFIDAVHKINRAGYDADYISDNFIRSSVCEKGMIKTAGGQLYKALIVPGARRMPVDVLEHLAGLAQQGATIVFLNRYPEDVPGFKSFKERRKSLESVISRLPKAAFNVTRIGNIGIGRIITGDNYTQVLELTGVHPEWMKRDHQLSMIRRKNTDGHHYFISALKETDTDGWIPLAVPARSAVIYNPLNGGSGKAAIRQNNGKTEVKLQLRSGESIILKTFEKEDVNIDEWLYYESESSIVALNNDWIFHFVESTPPINYNFVLKEIVPWTNMDFAEAKINMGTGVYQKAFNLEKGNFKEWLLDLGDVRETARVRINGRNVATLWSVPYTVFVGKYLLEGRNTIEIEVTSLPANRIAEMDRQGAAWRQFKEINFVDLNYQNTGYGHWKTMPAGLNGQVKLIPVSKVSAQ